MYHDPHMALALHKIRAAELHAAAASHRRAAASASRRPSLLEMLRLRRRGPGDTRHEPVSASSPAAPPLASGT